MSNSKVRIYELSKELNLDNKDILEICDQLNIAVKSHSSTITESQAERIKATAEKYIHQMAGKPNTGSISDRGLNPSGERKQEILAIHHKQNRSFAQTASDQLLVEPPRPPMRPQSVSAISPSTTADLAELDSSQEDIEVLIIEEKPEVQPLVEPIVEQDPEQNQPEQSQIEQNQLEYNQQQNQLEQESAISSSELSELDVPKLLRPPVRPSEKPVNTPVPAPVKEAKLDEQSTAQPISPKDPKDPKENPEKAKITTDIRPKINKDGKKAERPEKDKKSVQPQPKVRKEPREARETREPREQREPREARETREPREQREPREARETREPREVKLLTELKRPTPPKPPAKPKSDVVELGIDPDELEETREEDLLTEEDPLDALTQKPKLKRPTPPRVGKRQDWDEEEEETEEGKAKAGKLAKTGKGKRRQNLLEDDDDFESELAEALEIPTAVSISTARPPKPKSMAKAMASPSGGPKNVKAPTKAEAGRQKNDRSERRDRKEQPQRAETLVLDKMMTVRELSERLGVPETEIIRILFFKGIAVNITQTLELDTIEAIAQELEIQIESPQEKAAATKITEMLDEQDLENLHRRPPVVTIMGHVDHGKTTLLDSIRKTKVAQGEAGGITQHIGAYHVDVEHEGKQQQIVFLDTPGHEAFTAMRARGARVTDIAVLVVAADDGVQPQTREAISHAKAAGVPIVVAINKVDKADSNPDRIKQELSELALVPEEWGGDTIMVPVSALKGENLDTLLEMILLVAEIAELSANPDRLAKGTVIEANLDRTRGPVATLLVQNGTLRVGDIIVAGSVLGKIRAMIDDRGSKVEEASPSFAVEILGLNEVPAAGDEFDVFENEKEARAISEQRTQEQRNSRLQQALSSRRISLTTLSAQAQEGKLKELNLILKADVQGSVEAILGSLKQLPQNEVQIRILLAAAGEITETDVDLAAASGAVIVGFNTTLASGSRQAADQEGIDIREYNIIYKLLDDIQAAMEGLLDPEEVESHLGFAEVRAVFAVGRGAVAGCYVQSGKLIRNRNLRVRRKGEVIYEGVLDSLKRMKEDAREVNAGYECGIGVNKFNDWQEGDQIEVYEMTMKRRTLSTK